MSTERRFPANCTQCPHLDRFHGACSHELRQTIIRELLTEDPSCPISANTGGD